MTLFTISCLDDQDSPYKFNVLITGRSGSSKSVLANGIFGGSLVTERHGVVTDSREENLQYYRATTDTHNSLCLRLRLLIADSLYTVCGVDFI